MKSIYKILKLARVEVVRGTDPDEPKEMLDHVGLCSVMRELQNKGRVNTIERNLFTDYLYDHRPKYRRDSMYFWKPFNKAYRLNWLDKHIALNKPN